MRTKYMIWDLETQNYNTYNRFCNPFDPQNFVVARGWKVQGDAQNSCSYHNRSDVSKTAIPRDVKLLVGHNIKFDLLYEWAWIKETFLKDGGCIWDTQYAEYLLQGQDQAYHMNSLDQLAPLYGGTVKIDQVKALWEAGVKTADIDPDLLLEYLANADNKQGGDIGNTEKVFLGQFKKAKALGLLPMIMARMEGLLCTTEMEFNGIHVDQEEGEVTRQLLIDRINQIMLELRCSLPADIPAELEFNWGSKQQVSCLLFGGSIKYSAREQIIKDGIPQFKQVEEQYQDGVYKSGKRKGDPIIRKRKVNTDVPRTKLTEHIYTFKRLLKPLEKYRLETTAALKEPLYSVSWDSLNELPQKDLPLLKLLLEYGDRQKDLSVYYWVQDSKGKRKGMLTCVMPDGCIHHSLNHTSTVTTRLSSTSPNLQNVPREDTSEVKKMFCSRFKDGLMIESDYNQLEVVGQAWLSGDINLTQDIIDAIDMHCRRVAAKFNISYEDALYWCKDESAPDHQLWKNRRTGAKVFTFQRAYGAGATKIAASTGMPKADVEDMIKAEEALYPGVVQYNAKVAQEVLYSSVPYREASGKVYRKGMYIAPTGTRYSFRSYDAPDFLREREELDTFKPTEMKNYPVQGTSGELVQLVLGRLFRWFLMNDNYQGSALLVNTVHDCVWADTKSDKTHEVARDMKRIMENIPEYIQEVYKLPCKVPFRVEVEIGSTLYTKEKLDLKEVA